ncbi:YbaB/EbfC family nucleoid-associated protein [Fuchsiella alkaliacetigena]|uniref:YbaB/EbfC family nucleoid-associated protein n=1 Tax=Fuchsiella alkaliacetigena TaxID=957042 RepID=UPI00200ADF07|nr:YbaB/EbfC family nucleoid-associated protein [Fuchsiella alkaliacetigena]MCK8824512.1 YbaB/EbfC family nucleoid-associated protein [Fuchsiella alkaliacetigena]
MDMGKMMKQVQKMQSQMKKAQEDLADEEVEATAGGGVVKVVANGKQEIVDISIDPDAVDPEDVEMLEDLILAATNEAMRKVQDMASEKMGDLTGGMNIPGLF